MDDNLKIPQLEDLQLQLYLIEVSNIVKILIEEIKILQQEIKELKSS